MMKKLHLNTSTEYLSTITTTYINNKKDRFNNLTQF